MGAWKRRKPSPPPKQDRSRKIGSLIGSGENYKRNSDFALHAERDAANIAARLSRLLDGIVAVASCMKTPFAPCVASLIAVGVLAGNALADKPVNQAAEHKKKGNEETVFVTGSLIPQRVKRKRIGTTTVSPVRIIDRREIDGTGRRTTRGVLIADPSVRVVGH